MSYRRPPKGRWRLTAALGTLYAVVLGAIVFWPTRVTAPFGTQLAALRTVIPYGDTLLEIAANVALFMPLGFVAARLLPAGRRWAGAALGFSVSILVELTQAGLLPDRVASARDVAANSLGAALGTFAMILIENSAECGHLSADQSLSRDAR